MNSRSRASSVFGCSLDICSSDEKKEVSLKTFTSIEIHADRRPPRPDRLPSLRRSSRCLVGTIRLGHGAVSDDIVRIDKDQVERTGSLTSHFGKRFDGSTDSDFDSVRESGGIDVGGGDPGMFCTVDDRSI